MDNAIESLLRQLGFSGLEAEAYLAVLSEPDISAYRVSQILGKAAPNTYKALDSLLAKGAVLADEGGRSRTFTAVAVRELIGQTNRRLEILARDIEKGLENMPQPKSGEGVYRLNTVHQVIARAKEMIAEASISIVVDSDPEPMKELLDDFVAAAGRGVKVLLQGREEIEVKGCEVVASVTEGWPGNLLVLLVDGSQYMFSFFTSDMRSLSHAVWSGDTFIAACFFRSYMVKALFYRISMMIGEGQHTLEEIRLELLRLWNDWGYGNPGNEALEKLLRK